MVRDTIKDKSYFDDFILKKNELINKNINKYKNDLIKKDRIQSVINFTIGLYKNMLIAKYSRGDDMFSGSIANDYNRTVDLIYDNWEENQGKFIYSEGKETIILNQYTLSMYLSTTEFLSLGILINEDNEKLKKLMDIIIKDNVKDSLLNFLMQYLDNNIPDVTKESYKKFFHINERLGRLKTIIKETDKNTAEKELKYFLENEWYASFKGTPLYDLHNNRHNIYAGYWCFVAAAIVKIKGLDDSSFRDNKYYPKDMLNN